MKLSYLKKFFTEKMTRTCKSSLWTLEPTSSFFGFDRGLPIDRWYIEHFLEKERMFIHGRVLEIADCNYSKKFGQKIEAYEIFHTTEDNSKATIVGDLCDISTLPKETVDCFICSQTFHVIYNVSLAIQGAYHLLKQDGVLLATMPGISQISRYDMDRWGDYWRFTTLSAKRIFGDIFHPENVEVKAYGNVLSAIAFLHGLSAEELKQKELDYHDPDYEVLITVRAVKQEERK